MSTSPLRRTIAWTLPAALVVSSVAVAATSATAAPADAPTVKAQATGGGDTIVGLGDSYMSGEGVMYANHNFPKGEGSTPSNWQTGPGALGNEVVQLSGDRVLPLDQQAGQTWRSVFGDANGWPDIAPGEPVGVEEIPFCDRSFAAAPMLGGGWTTKNLACSGATSQSKVSEGKTAGLFGTKPFYYAKPGVDFETIEVDKTPRAQVEQDGQARLLQTYASGNPNIKVVALSIGGNDFGFGDLGYDCILSGSTGGRCETDPKVREKVAEGIPKARDAVKRSIANIAQAMAAAGYRPDQWRLVYQNPPLPVTLGKNTKWKWEGLAGGERAGTGGCGLADSTLDWVVETVYKDLVGGMLQGLKESKDALNGTQVVQVDTEDTFNGHRLCEKGTLGATNYPQGQAGKNPTWQPDNGQKTEWVTYIARLESASGNIYQKSMPLHPNYWGQRALSACMSKAAELEEGSVTVSCTQDASESLDVEGRPKMNVAQTQALWVVAAGKPLIAGLPNVGQTLTADVDDVFKPSSLSYSYDYEWLSDGTPIPGATNKTYAVQAPDLGKTITVKVTGTAAGFDPVVATSEGVDVSDIIVDTRPSITGDAKVGATLTLSPGAYTPTPDTFAYQWYADGAPIAGATSTEYTATVEDLGKRLSVKVTATKAGHQELSLFTDETAEIAQGALTVTGTPAISGTTRVGETLTADLGSVVFTPAANRVSYRWYRNGTFITGATEATFEVTGDDVGKTLTVSIVGESDGYGVAESQQSAATATVSKGAIEKLKTPKVKYLNRIDALSRIPRNRIRFGNSVEVDLFGVFSEWPNDPTIEWFRDTVNQASAASRATIKGADGLTYVPKVSDIGSRIKARVTTRDKGWEQATAQTAWYTIVKGKHDPVKAPKIKGKAKVGQRLATTKARFLPRSGDVRYQWYANGTKIKGATGRVYRAEPSVKGRKLRVKAYIRETKGFEAASVWSKKVGPVKAVKGLG